MSTPHAAYVVEIPGLSQSVASALPPATSPAKHTTLLAAIRRHATLENAVLATVRGDAWLSRRKVLTATGELVHDDHKAWLSAECDRDSGNVVATWRRLQPLDYRLTECRLTKLYVAVDRGGARADDFVQLEVDLEDEHIDRRLFEADRTYAPTDLTDLVWFAEDGPRLELDKRRRVRQPAYRLRRTVDVARFVDEAQQLDTSALAAIGRRLVSVTTNGGAPKVMPMAEMEPEAFRLRRWKGGRLFDDWTMSSAGRSGARLCEHWALQLTDWTDPRLGERTLSLIPLWTYARPLAEVDRPRLSDYALYSKLETLDRRVKVPFGWYFYMLHGNRVHDWAAHRVIRAAEAGRVVLPEHDYRVLKAWERQPYGF